MSKQEIEQAVSGLQEQELDQMDLGPEVKWYGIVEVPGRYGDTERNQYRLFSNTLPEATAEAMARDFGDTVEDYLEGDSVDVWFKRILEYADIHVPGERVAFFEGNDPGASAVAVAKTPEAASRAFTILTSSGGEAEWK